MGGYLTDISDKGLTKFIIDSMIHIFRKSRKGPYLSDKTALLADVKANFACILHSCLLDRKFRRRFVQAWSCLSCDLTVHIEPWPQGHRTCQLLMVTSWPHTQHSLTTCLMWWARGHSWHVPLPWSQHESHGHGSINWIAMIIDYSLVPLSHYSELVKY